MTTLDKLWKFVVMALQFTANSSTGSSSDQTAGNHSAEARGRRKGVWSRTTTTTTSSKNPRWILLLCLAGTCKFFFDMTAITSSSTTTTSITTAQVESLPFATTTTIATAGVSSSNSNSDEPAYRSSQAMDIMQVVRTRFMQRQPNLVHLGQSRLELFKTFCLPTMLIQTLQDFAWLVYTDPDLDPSLLGELRALLQAHPNFYLILSNDNQLTLPDLVQKATQNPSMVLTGNLEYLTRSYQRHATSQASVVLYIETGLDADDGLQRDALSEIQKHAVAETFLWNSPTQRSDSYHWFILCVGNHYEWKNVDVFLGRTTDFRGLIAEHHNPERCVTPGLTMVNSLTAPHGGGDRLPIFEHAPFSYNEIVVNHWRLNEKYPNCRNHGATQFEPCWKQINEHAQQQAAAIRARTITSTGMKDVLTATAEEQVKSNGLWHTLKEEFGIRVGAVKMASRQIFANRVETVTELMKGRCQKGHSCLDKTEASLQELLQQLKQAGDGSISKTVST